MTECERIIKEGVLPESFFKPVTICDFYVDENRKKMWAVEIDLFLKLYEVCKKYDLQIWADGGSLLGAVRHKGFIPWDDDMDFIMPRKDYNKLMELGPKVFEYPYFLQNPHTDPECGFVFSKLRNSNTTAMPKLFRRNLFNQGIDIDIFPLDYVDVDNYEQEREAITTHIMKSASYMKKNVLDELDERQLENYTKYEANCPCVEYDEIHKIASLTPKGDYVTNKTVITLPKAKMLWKVCWYAETVMLPFECIQVPAPYSYEERLTAQYRDFMQFPPVHARGQWHPNVIRDMEKSYKEYIEVE